MRETRDRNLEVKAAGNVEIAPNDFCDAFQQDADRRRMVFTLPAEGVGLETLVSSEESLKSIYSQKEDTSGLINWSISKIQLWNNN